MYSTLSLTIWAIIVTTFDFANSNEFARHQKKSTDTNLANEDFEQTYLISVKEKEPYVKLNKK